MTLNQTPRSRLVLPLNYVQLAILWLMMLVSWFVFVEPSPYEIMFVAVFLVFLPNGLIVCSALFPLIVFLLLYNVGGALSLTQVSHSNDARTFVVTSFYMAASALTIAMIVTGSPMRAFAVIRNGYVLAAVLAAACGIAGYFDVAGTGELFAVYGRAKSAFKDPNVFSTFLALPAAILVQGLANGTQKHKLLSTAALAIIAAGVFLSFSRGAWIVMILACAGSLTLSFILTPSLSVRSRLVLFSIGGVVAAAILLVFALSIPDVRTLFLERFQLFQSYDTGETGRFGAQLNSIPMLLEAPNGFGPLQYGKIFDVDPHNVYLNAFASYGWLGGFSYLLLTVSTLASGWKCVTTVTPWQAYAIPVFATLSAIIIQGVQIDTDHWRHFYLLLGVQWGLYAAAALRRS